MENNSHSYWLDVPLLLGKKEKPRDGEILIIGSGLSGASCAYWLQKEGFKHITVVDYQTEQAASFRNCGHILYGTVESMQALVALHGYETAKEIWGFSIEVCQAVKDTVAELGVDVEYRADGYLVIAIDASEDHEIQRSIGLLQDMGYPSRYVSAETLKSWGFLNTFGGRYEEGSAQAHPVKFRNALMQAALKQGLHYYSGVQIQAVEEGHGQVKVSTQLGDLYYDAVVIASNAYSSLLSSFFAQHRLVEPFRGQIICSQALRSHRFPVSYPHSFDHGYEYALVTRDNRLMIGGWRNKTPKGEIGTFDITPNLQVEEGLQQFVKEHYAISEPLRWEYSWAGIMATSKTGFPFIGPTDSPRIFTCAGYTGHGFSWAHGSAQLLAAIMAGKPIPSVARYFNPQQM